MAAEVAVRLEEEEEEVAVVLVEEAKAGLEEAAARGARAKRGAHRQLELGPLALREGARGQRDVVEVRLLAVQRAHGAVLEQRVQEHPRRRVDPLAAVAAVAAPLRGPARTARVGAMQRRAGAGAAARVAAGAAAACGFATDAPCGSRTVRARGRPAGPHIRRYAAPRTMRQRRRSPRRAPLASLPRPCRPGLGRGLGAERLAASHSRSRPSQPRTGTGPWRTRRGRCSTARRAGSRSSRASLDSGPYGEAHVCPEAPAQTTAGGLFRHR